MTERPPHIDDASPADDALAERLRSALAATQRAPVPRDLVQLTMAAVQGERQPPRRTGFAFVRFAGLAAAVLIVLVGVGTGILRVPSTPPAAMTPADTQQGQTGPTAGPTAISVAPPDMTFPTTADGLEVVSVSAATQQRDTSSSASGPLRVAVRGWYSASPPVGCPAGGIRSPLLGDCAIVTNALAESFEAPISDTWREPSVGPFLQPRFLTTSAAFDPRVGARPIAVVFVGHFFDPSAASCEAADRAACEQAFVVDRVAWVEGATASPPPAALPSTVLGLPVIDVQAALALQNADTPPSRPLGVSGWVAGEADFSCEGSNAPFLEMELSCTGRFPGLSGAQDASGGRLRLVTDGGGAGNPSGPQTVVIGHFSDPRAADCRAGLRDACAREFVVDAVPWDNGAWAGPWLSVSGNGGSYAEETLRQAISSAVPDAQPFGILIGPAADLAATDPDLRGIDLPTGKGDITIARALTPTGFVSVQVVEDPATNAYTVVKVYGPATAFPLTIAGQPVLTVSEAIAARDDTTSLPVQLAVRGWFTPAPPLPCPKLPSPAPTQALTGGCPASLAALTERREVLQSATGWNNPSADNPSLNPRFITTESPAYPAAGQPLAAVLVGHFHDAAAVSCAPADQVACGQAFVVDRVAWTDGGATTSSPGPDGRLSCSAADCTTAAALVEAADPAAYGAAARIIFVGECAPWMRCLMNPAQVVVLVPPGWRGDASALRAYSVDSGRLGGTPLVTARSSLGSWQLATVGGYTIACAAGLDMTTCYDRAVEIATAEWQRSSIAIRDVAVTDVCGSFTLMRTDGIGITRDGYCSTASPSPAN